MKKIIQILLIVFTFISCNSKETIIEDAISHHDNGNPKVVYYYKVLKGGKQECIRERWFYAEGEKHLDGPIVNDKRNGMFETYYPSGKVMSKGEFVDGKREGKATTFYENGKINYEGEYKNGKECGIWKFYNENGELINEIDRDKI